MSNSLLCGDAVVLAGATGRVGGATLRALVAHGAARVLVVSRVLANAERAITTHLDAGDRERAHAFEADLTSLGGGEGVANAARSRFGRIDAVVSLAGGGSPFVTIANSTPNDLETSVRNNLYVAYNTIVPALRAMLAQPARDGARSRGRLVVVTAGSSLDPQPDFGIMGIGKAGVNLLILAIARECKTEGIVGNAIVLGGVATEAARSYLDATDFAAAVTPAEVGDVLAFHASDASSGINGTLVHLNAREID